jgi:hypothetical protein
VAFLPLYFLRVPREEQMMLDHFCDDYRSYAAQTGRIVPRLRGHSSASTYPSVLCFRVWYSLSRQRRRTTLQQTTSTMSPSDSGIATAAGPWLGYHCVAAPRQWERDPPGIACENFCRKRLRVRNGGARRVASPLDRPGSEASDACPWRHARRLGHDGRRIANWMDWFTSLVTRLRTGS